jgi:dTDP-4-amino-4,6-dideoxygalactose transaminase
MIPVCDSKRQYFALQHDIDAAMRDVAASGRYILGPQVRDFEQEVAEYLGCKYAVGVANGTDALHLALRALDVGPGDEVITTPFTFIATTEAIGIVGATPVFVDIDPGTLNIDVGQLESAITNRTKAILPVHLFGQPCEIDSIRAIADRHGLRVVEDCAQATGATYQGQRVGSFGDFGCFSFFPSKNLGCCGDGGLVVTDDESLFRRVEMLRRHGGAVKYHHTEMGLNSRLDELQAAILRVKLPHLDRWNAQRRSHACYYNEQLSGGLDMQVPIELCVDRRAAASSHETNERLTAVYHQYTVLVEERDGLAPKLRELGVETGTYYPVPLHLQKVHRDLDHRPGSFPSTESVSQRCLSLPIFPELEPHEREQVAETLKRIVGEAALPKGDMTFVG